MNSTSNLITAATAATIAKESQENAAKELLKKINEAITEDAKQGLFYTVYHPLPIEAQPGIYPQIVQALSDLGYKATMHNMNADPFITISWTS